jgi:hypothetical protein
MNRFNGTDVDLEAATDQLVDEICQRLATLYALVDLPMRTTGPPVDVIRANAAAVISRLAGPQSRPTAVAVARALWPPHLSGHAPPPWWSTPLGALIQRAWGTEPRPRSTPHPP